jgi:hypothetical protein
MGARVSRADDQTPMGKSGVMVRTRDAAGRAVRRWEYEPDPTVLEIVHFVDLDDGRRVTTKEFGEMSLEMSLDCSEDELRAEVREFIFEEEMRSLAELADEPRWDDMVKVLARDVRVDEALEQCSADPPTAVGREDGD